MWCGVVCGTSFLCAGVVCDTFLACKHAFLYVRSLCVTIALPRAIAKYIVQYAIVIAWIVFVAIVLVDFRR